MNDIVTIDFYDRKIKKLIKKAGKRGVSRATIALWKVIKTSIRKNAGRKSNYDLNVYFPEPGKPLIKSKYRTVREHLSRPSRANEEIVIRDSKRDSNPIYETNVKKQNKTSAPGQLPLSHSSIKPGWRNYWLRESIWFDKEAGVVYLNPDRRGNRILPKLIEQGGATISYRKTLVGYAVFSKSYKNGKRKVSYSRIYSKKVKPYNVEPRPFMKPGAKKARPYIIKCLRDEIAKKLKR